MIPIFDHTGPFIWAAYGVSALLLWAAIGYVLWRARAAEARLSRLEREEEEG